MLLSSSPGTDAYKLGAVSKQHDLWAKRALDTTGYWIYLDDSSYTDTGWDAGSTGPGKYEKLYNLRSEEDQVDKAVKRMMVVERMTVVIFTILLSILPSWFHFSHSDKPS